jgi:hypothetical protein
MLAWYMGEDQHRVDVPMARPSGSSPFARYVPPRKVREAGLTGLIMHLRRSAMLTRRTPRDSVMTSGLGRCAAGHVGSDGAEVPQLLTMAEVDLAGLVLEDEDTRLSYFGGLGPAGRREPGECSGAHSAQPAAGRGLSGAT